MTNSNSLNAKRAFEVLLGFVGYSLLISLLGVVVGPMAWTGSVITTTLVGLVQMAGLVLAFGWSKELNVQGGLVVTMACLAGVMVTRLAGATSIVGLLALAQIIAFLVWMHGLYKALGRNDLMKLESGVALFLLVGILLGGFLPGALKAICIMAVALSLLGYFGHAFWQLRKEAINF